MEEVGSVGSPLETTGWKPRVQLAQWQTLSRHQYICNRTTVHAYTYLEKTNYILSWLLWLLSKYVLPFVFDKWTTSDFKCLFYIVKLTFWHILLLILPNTHPHFQKGDILLVAEKFDDGWIRGMRLSDLEVCVLFLVLSKLTSTFLSCRLDTFLKILLMKMFLQSTNWSMHVVLQRWSLSCDVHIMLLRDVCIFMCVYISFWNGQHLPCFFLFQGHYFLYRTWLCARWVLCLSLLPVMQLSSKEVPSLSRLFFPSLPLSLRSEVHRLWLMQKVQGCPGQFIYLLLKMLWDCDLCIVAWGMICTTLYTVYLSELPI